jgi:hypothetical protein
VSETAVLVKLGIDPDAGTELAEGSRQPGPLFLRFVMERCLLVAESQEAAAGLLRAFQAGGSVELAQAFALLVQSHLELAPPPAPVPIEQIANIDEVHSWGGLVDLLVLANYRFACLDEAAAGNAPEFTTLRDALNTVVVDQANAMWNGYLVAGQDRETVWRERFEPLARNTHRVCLLDRYLATALAEELSRTVRAKPAIGAEWFLAHLARTGITRLQIASSARSVREKGRTADEARDLITGWFRGLDTRTKLDLRIVEGNFDHGRRIAFEGWAGFELHNGLASFDKPRLTEGMGLVASPVLAREVVDQFRSL